MLFIYCYKSEQQVNDESEKLEAKRPLIAVGIWVITVQIGSVQINMYYKRVKIKIMDYEQIESSQRQHHELLRQQEAMIEVYTGAEYKLFAMLKPKLYKDGNEWCCLYGDDTTVGIAGFGETPHKAISDWTASWHKS